MSENQRKKTKITIENPCGKTEVLEVSGIAALAVTELEDKKTHEISTVLIGQLSSRDLIAIYEGIRDELLPTISKEIVSHLYNSEEVSGTSPKMEV